MNSVKNRWKKRKKEKENKKKKSLGLGLMGCVMVLTKIITKFY